VAKSAGGVRRPLGKRGDRSLAKPLTAGTLLTVGFPCLTPCLPGADVLGSKGLCGEGPEPCGSGSAQAAGAAEPPAGGSPLTPRGATGMLVLGPKELLQGIRRAGHLRKGRAREAA